MNKPLYLFVGKSSSGKTTIAEKLVESNGYKQVYSYTTRPPRYDGEIGHEFIDDETFDNLSELVAYTEYNGSRYGTTAEQLDQCSIFVVDVPGVETLLQNYKTNRPITIIYFDSTVRTRINRMLGRGDSEANIIARLLQDEKDDWYKQLDSLAWKSVNLKNRIVDLYKVDANKNLVEVMEQVLYYMNRHMEV